LEHDVRILLTNDDGIQAAGINRLAEELESRGHEVLMAAPESERSAASHSITIHKPIRVTEIAPRRWSVSGTPVDCIFLALEVLCGTPPDLVISGINSGQNMGEDILYSGTVAAALEAMMLGQKAIAVSIRDYRDQLFETAAIITADLVEDGLGGLTDASHILNINVPNLPLDQVAGITATRIGHRKYRNFVKELGADESGKDYMVGGDVAYWSPEPGTDYHEVAEGKVSITPIYPRFDTPDRLPALQEWLKARNRLRVKR
jgi:5'-nucleotidase